MKVKYLQQLDWQHLPWFESSNIKSISYAAKEKLLMIEFRNVSNPYIYNDVAVQEWQAIKEADSKGKIINQLIKPHHSYEKIMFNEKNIKKDNTIENITNIIYSTFLRQTNNYITLEPDWDKKYNNLIDKARIPIVANEDTKVYITIEKVKEEK